MQKIDELIQLMKSNELLCKKQPPKEEKKVCPLVWVAAIIGGIAVIAGIAYVLYRYFTPDYVEDFEDDFDDDFDDDFFEDEEEDDTEGDEEADSDSEKEKE